jgi:hypothetical protein
MAWLQSKVIGGAYEYGARFSQSDSRKLAFPIDGANHGAENSCSDDAAVAS